VPSWAFQTTRGVDVPSLNAALRCSEARTVQVLGERMRRGIRAASTEPTPILRRDALRRGAERRRVMMTRHHARRATHCTSPTMHRTRASRTAEHAARARDASLHETFARDRDPSRPRHRRDFPPKQVQWTLSSFSAACTSNALVAGSLTSRRREDRPHDASHEPIARRASLAAHSSSARRSARH
jgi:hypothetical protein